MALTPSAYPAATYGGLTLSCITGRCGILAADLADCGTWAGKQTNYSYLGLQLIIIFIID